MRDLLSVHEGPILICYDGSEQADRAIVAAETLLAGRRAVVLDVTELVVDGGWSWPSSDALWVDPVAEVNALARAKAGARLAEWAGFEAEARTDAALDVWQGIDRVAEEIDAAAIVIGSRGLRGLRASLEGSVSRQVEATARRPVLLVPSAS